MKGGGKILKNYKKTKYLIFGNGYLGNKFKNYLANSELISARVSRIEEVRKIILSFSPEVVINCIGKTGRPNVDWCELNKIETFYSNVSVPLIMAEVCNELNIRFVHIGSGCIFEGDNGGKGFTEQDNPNFRGSFYSKTKIWSEEVLEDYNFLNIRIRMPIDSKPDSRNLLSKLITYDKIIDIDNSITVISDLLEITEKLIQLEETGTFNVVNKQPVRHKEILAIYERSSNKKLNYTLINENELKSMTVAGRSNCVLNTSKLEKVGIVVPDTIASLEKCISDYTRSETD